MLLLLLLLEGAAEQLDGAREVCHVFLTLFPHAPLLRKLVAQARRRSVRAATAAVAVAVAMPLAFARRCSRGGRERGDGGVVFGAARAILAGDAVIALLRELPNQGLDLLALVRHLHWKTQRRNAHTRPCACKR